MQLHERYITVHQSAQHAHPPPMTLRLLPAAILMILGWATSLSAQILGEGPVKELIVWSSEGADPALCVREWNRALGLEDGDVRHLGSGFFRIDAPFSRSEDALATLRKLASVRYAGPNREADLRSTKPNDPSYINQWHHQLLGSELAWDITTGGTTANGHRIVVAILDSGFELAHEDIAPNLWVNEGEIAGDGLDNDNNGYVDDRNGMNLETGNGKDIPLHSHGHSVIGYIGSRGNNALGISGLSWDVDLMLLGGGSSIKEDEVITALNFVYTWRKEFNVSNGANGAYIPAVNMSLGFSGVKPENLPWMCPLVRKLGEVGVIVVAAAPNDNLDIELKGDMPCVCDASNLICVTNTTNEDQLVYNAGYSRKFVHMGAPGFTSFTTRLTSAGTYGTFSGTSAATPMVTGAIGLLAAMPCQPMQDILTSDPATAAAYLRTAVLEGTVPIDDLDGITVTGGRLCLWCEEEGTGAVMALANLCGSAEGPVEVLAMRPNPADGLVYIDLRSPGSTPLPIRIHNMQGQLIWESEYVPETFLPKVIEVNVSHWPSGIYLITAGVGKSRKTGKMAVHH